MAGRGGLNLRPTVGYFVWLVKVFISMRHSVELAVGNLGFAAGKLPSAQFLLWHPRKASPTLVLVLEDTIITRLYISICYIVYLLEQFYL